MLQDLSLLESSNILCGKDGDSDLALATAETEVLDCIMKPAWQHVFNPGTPETEAYRVLLIQGQPGAHIEFQACQD